MSKVKLTRKPDKEEVDELKRLELECVEILEDNNLLRDTHTPKEVVNSLRNFIDLYKVGNITKKTQNYDMINLAYGMGELYASTIIDIYSWNYEFVEKEDGFSSFAVVSPNKKWCIFIHNYFYTLLYEKSKSNNLLLTFNMIDAKGLQKYEKDEYTPLS